MPENGIIPSLWRLAVGAHCPALIRVQSVFRTLTKSCRRNRLTQLSHCKHCKPSRTVAMQCQGQWSTERSVCDALCGENNVYTHDWLSWTGTCTWRRLQTTLTGPQCMCMASWTRVCSVNVNNVLLSPPSYSPIRMTDSHGQVRAHGGDYKQHSLAPTACAWPAERTCVPLTLTTFYCPFHLIVPPPPSPKCGTINGVDCIRFSSLRENLVLELWQERPKCSSIICDLIAFIRNVFVHI